MRILNTEVFAHRLKFAVSAADAGGGILVMIGKESVPESFYGFNNLLCFVQTSMPSLTGYCRTPSAFSHLDLHDAHTAVSYFINSFQKAKSRDVDIRLVGSFQNRCALRYGYLDTVYL